ncbi:PqqD family protein [Clostridium algoriphilum]|uniref:PqqD family protein n=1 Tax=Clostridium algoriphilum TaxID=198347 RepID=UPI001CF26EB1|nr:PqqD family protein [Clostridium algoriphilum]MCB2293441.1 PqqD family protein [Clostridium algoriphilum]
MLNKKNKDKSQENFLLYRPLRKIEEWEVTDDTVKLFFRHDKPVERFMRWLIKKSKVSDIKLDDRGSMVWQLCDGTRTVYDIALAMVERFNDTEQNSIDRLIMFLRYLSRRGWITFEK